MWRSDMSGADERSPMSRARLLAAAVAGVAGATVGVVAGVAIAKTATLHVAKNAEIKNVFGATTPKSLVVNGRAFPIYELSGDSKAHPKCTKANGCLSVWFPVTVSSARKLSKGPGVPGKLGTWRRKGMLQVTLNGHPVYTFATDSARQATGDGVISYGGTWHVVPAAGAGGGSTTSGTTTGGTTTGGTTTGGTTTTGTTTGGTTSTSTTDTTTTNTTTTQTTTTTTTCAYPQYCY
jgi:predicted lipoprotein with Yx(FWY)xxD motif